jgi:hypothetical protein
VNEREAQRGAAERTRETEGSTPRKRAAALPAPAPQNQMQTTHTHTKAHRAVAEAGRQRRLAQHGAVLLVAGDRREHLDGDLFVVEGGEDCLFFFVVGVCVCSCVGGEGRLGVLEAEAAAAAGFLAK